MRGNWFEKILSVAVLDVHDAVKQQPCRSGTIYGSSTHGGAEAWAG